MRFVLKLIGFILLIIGVSIILYALWSSFELFTAKKPAPIIFNIAEQQKSSGEPDITGANNPISAETVIKELAKNLTANVPAEYTATILNMISWSVLALIMIFGGSQLAKLGITLLSSI